MTGAPVTLWWFWAFLLAGIGYCFWRWSALIPLLWRKPPAPPVQESATNQIPEGVRVRPIPRRVEDLAAAESAWIPFLYAKNGKLYVSKLVEISSARSFTHDIKISRTGPHWFVAEFDATNGTGGLAIFETKDITSAFFFLPVELRLTKGEKV